MSTKTGNLAREAERRRAVRSDKTAPRRERDAAEIAADRAERAGLPITRAKKRADRNPERTRAAILAAAEEEFAAKGYDGARLANIAAGAKVQQALIYHYFADKESLYEEVMREGLAGTSARVWELISVMQTAVSGGAAAGRHDKMGREDVRTLVTAFVELLGEFFAEHASLVAMLSFELRKGERAVRFVEERVRPMFESVITELEKMRDRGEVNRKVSPRELAISAVGIVAYPIESKRLVGAVWPSFDPRARERKEHIVELLCSALLP